MKILYITTSYILKNSSAAIRNNSLVNGLCELGHEVDVLTVKWPDELHSDYLLNEAKGNIISYELQNLQKVSKLKVSSLGKASSSKIISKFKTLVKKLIFFPDECYELSKVVKYKDLLCYDNVITSSDHKSSHYVGLKLKTIKPTINWIQVWGDPWSSDVNTLPILKGLYGVHEKSLLHAADKVIYISTATREFMVQKHPRLGNKLQYIPRGFFCRVETNTLNNNPIKIVYTGILSFGRNIENLLSAISLNPNYNIEVHVYGDASNVAMSLTEKYKCLKVFPSVSQTELIKVYSDTSILLYLSNSRSSSQIPGKLYDYMGTNRPVLCLVHDTNDLISQFLKKHDRCFLCENTMSEILTNFDSITSLAEKIYPINEEYSPKSIAEQFNQFLV